jgi:hypothetical protein
MNHKKIGLRDQQKFVDNFENYSLGEVYYAILRSTGAKKISDLLLLTDEEIATSINQAIYKESE